MKFDTKAKQLGLQSHILHMGMFDFHVRLLIGDYKKSVGLVRDFHDVDWQIEREPRGECFYQPGYAVVLWLPRKPRTAEDIGTFTHETVHAVVAMFDYFNMPIDRSTNETFAHAVGYIVTEFKKALQ